MSQAGMLSPDGRWQWDGQQWQPYVPSAPKCPQCGMSDAIRSVRSVSAEGTSTLGLGGVSASAGMSGRYVTWNTGVTVLGGQSTSALAQLLGPPRAPANPAHTWRAVLGWALVIIGALFAMGGLGNASGRSASATSAAAVIVAGSLMVFIGGWLLKQDRSVRGRLLEAAQVHHRAAFDIWAALLYCMRCDVASHPQLGIMGPSGSVPLAVHAAASRTLHGPQRPGALVNGGWST